jgi:hypothetical protein
MKNLRKIRFHKTPSVALAETIFYHTSALFSEFLEIFKVKNARFLTQAKEKLDHHPVPRHHCCHLCAIRRQREVS